jgi:hypothetical protein
MRRRGNGKTQANQNGSVGKNAGHAETPSPAQVGAQNQSRRYLPRRNGKIKDLAHISPAKTPVFDRLRRVCLIWVQQIRRP